MGILVVVAVVAAVAGFGVGRIKNSAKLAAIKAELDKAESSVVAEVKKLVADIKSKL